jgi:ATP-dependent exoDNAse (exonuclease V) beta subunit
MDNIRLVSAGAGSGKTYRLTNELFDFLDPQGKYKYTPSEVIATTFTRMAAGELRDRVRRKILETGHHDIVDLLDQALIGTVNSVGGQLLSQFAFEGGLSPVLNVIEDTEKQSLFNLSLTEVISGEVANELDYLSARFSTSGDEIRGKIARLVDMARSNGMDGPGLEAARDKSISTMLDKLPAPEVSRTTACEFFVSAFPELSKTIAEGADGTSKTAVAFEELRTFVYNMEHYPAFVSWYEWSKICKLSPGVKSYPCFEPFIDFARDHLSFHEFHEDIRNLITFVFDKAIAALTLFQDYKRRRGVIDFADQEAEILRLLDQDDVKRRFRQQYKVLMVDEFQDTSPIQLALFLKISVLVEHVVWVGDPKQAIYGFRGTDSTLINAVVQRLGTPGEKDFLTESRRSRPDLVNFVNDVFYEAFKSKPEYPRKEQIVLKPVRKGLEDAGLDTALQVWGFSEKLTVPVFNDLLAGSVAAFIRENPLIQDPVSGKIRTLMPGDIAVLCFSNDACLKMANSLREHGVNATVADSGLQRRAETRLVMACLKYFDNPADSLAMTEVAYLTDPSHNIGTLIDGRLEYLEQKKVSNPGDAKIPWLAENSFIMRLNEIRKKTEALPLALLVRMLYADMDILQLVAVWGDQHQRWSNLQEILNYVDQFSGSTAAAGASVSIPSFIAWFNNLADSGEDEKALVINEYAVNVLTYHRSKGLEWPVVVMHELTHHRDADVFGMHVTGGEVINMEAPLSDRGIRYWPWPYTYTPFGKLSGYADFTTLFKSLPEQQTANNQSFEEALRLLYVGMTRARDYLILPCKDYNKMAWIEKAIDGGLTGICRPEPTQNDTVLSTNHKHYPSKFRFRRFSPEDLIPGHVTDAAAPVIYTPRTGVSHVQDYFITPSSAEEITKARIVEYIPLYPRIRVDQPGGGDDAAFGTCIHAILCAHRPEMHEKEQLQLIERLLENFGFTGIISPVNIVASILHFHDWTGRRYGSASFYKEYPMMVERDNQVLSGIADLVIETPEEILLVDYKTFPGHDDPDKIGESCEWRARTYSGQMDLYREMLERVWPGKKVETVIWFVIAGSLVKLDSRQE